MIYYGTESIERVFFKDKSNMHLIDISINANKNTFSVTCCCDEDWIWEFYYVKSTYERIKFIIMDLVYKCDSIGELLDALDDIFSEAFEDILIDEDEFECDGNCENCRFIED